MGIGETDRDSWTDTIWLTKDKQRPSPFVSAGSELISEDILIGSFTHNGGLQVGDSYQKTATVTIPKNVAGEWYITPWSDAVDIVIEETFDINNNPDDPNEIDNNNYKARPLTIIGRAVPDLEVTEVIPLATAIAGGNFSVDWTVTNRGASITDEAKWTDTIYLSSSPQLNNQSATYWTLGRINHQRSLDIGESYSASLDVNLAPDVSGEYIIVETNRSQNFGESDYTNNQNTGITSITNAPSDLIVTEIILPQQSFSGEKITVEWTVENTGAEIWSGTNYWYDEVWLSPDPTFIEDRATRLGLIAVSEAQTLNEQGKYTQQREFSLPAGIDGEYYIYVRTNSGYTLQAFNSGGDNEGSLDYYSSHVFENPSNNFNSNNLPVIYQEPDLEVTNLTIPLTPVESGSSLPISWTVTNIGTRDTREYQWFDRVYLSSDASLDFGDKLLGSFERQGQLGINQSYNGNLNVQLPENLAGNYHLLVFSDANLTNKQPWVTIPSPPPNAQIYYQKGLSIYSAKVPEFNDEDNNIIANTLEITAKPLPDLEVTNISIPEKITVGQDLSLSYTVTNIGEGITPDSQQKWQDVIYLSRDEFLDTRSDYYLGAVTHQGVLAPGENYSESLTFRTPNNLTGAYYVFIATDSQNKAVEFSETNNASPSLQPLLLELPPPADLLVTDINLDTPNARSGETITIDWTVINQGENAAKGNWSDGVYLSSDAVWDVNDQFLGRVSLNSTIAPSETYQLSLNVTLPPVNPGDYRIIVRPDLYNQVYEAENELNNRTTSPNSLNLRVEELSLGVAQFLNLTPGKPQLYQITVEENQTLKVSLDVTSDNVANELFIGYERVPTSINYDYAALEGLAADRSAVIPGTAPGTYYILVQPYSGNSSGTLTAELVPFSISDVVTDRGGDSRYVTVDILGAQFDEDAIVKFVRPGIAEYEPINYEVIDSSKIRAIFDFSNAPHGLYDVKVINPDGETAIIPYRYLIEQAIAPDVTIGLGGNRVLAPGDNGTYGFSVKSLTNIDTPYVQFQFGVPELGNNNFLFNSYSEESRNQIGVEQLPYIEFSSNLRGEPRAIANDVPWASLISDINIEKQTLAPGYIFDLATQDSAGFTFNAQTYPWLPELDELEPEVLKEISRGGFDGEVAFKFQIQAYATALTREEFIAQQTESALNLRTAILEDSQASINLQVLASDSETWVAAYLAALEAAGLLRASADAPPIEENPKVVSLVATLATGIIFSGAGETIRSDGNILNFFEQIREWYGGEVRSQESEVRSFTAPIHQQAFDIYVPFGKARVDLPSGTNVPLPDFASFLNGASENNNSFTLTGPISDSDYIPLGATLPYTIDFANTNNRPMAEVRLVSELDPDLDAFTFSLGDLRLGDISVNIPDNRSNFQGDFNFIQSHGIILRVSAGLEPNSNIVTWLLQAIDPETGEVVNDGIRGLLQSSQTATASYSILANDNLPTGTEISSSVRLINDISAPLDSNSVTNLIDGVAPSTTLNVSTIGNNNDYLLSWSSVDDESGSGLDSLTIYVAENGGDFQVWQRQVGAIPCDCPLIFNGEAGINYEFLALATDIAGNREIAQLGVNIPDSETVNLGILPDFPTNVPKFKPAPDLDANLTTNPLFTEAQQNIPNNLNSNRPSEFASILAPFYGEALVKDITNSHGNIGPMAIAELENGEIIFSGGSNRGSLYRVDRTGEQTQLITTLNLPVFDLEMDNEGSLWAATGGGALLKLDPATGEILGEYGDGITQSLAIEPNSNLIYLTTGNGIAIFDRSDNSFSQFSSVRAGNLAFGEDGSLWATTWPNRGEVVRFPSSEVIPGTKTLNPEPQLMFAFEQAIDSLAFGKPDTQLENLLFVSSNNGELILVDLARRNYLTVATGGSRGDIIETTTDGQVLLSQSQQIDVFAPITIPEVIATNPAPDAIIALPKNQITVTFDTDMALGAENEINSVLNPDNYTLNTDEGLILQPTAVNYDQTTRTARLTFANLIPEEYQLTVESDLTSVAGINLESDYIVDFTAVSDFSSLVDLEFTNTRSDRGNQTLSFDVNLTNRTDYDLVLPLMLLIEPANSNTGIPQNSIKDESGAYLLDLSEILVDGKISSGETISGYTVTVANPDALRFEFEPAIYTLPYPNQAPEFLSNTLPQAQVGQTYNYQINAQDSDGSIIGYLLYDAPEGMTIDAQTGLINWTPNATDLASTPVTVKVYDTRGGSSTATFTIAVAGGNHLPTINLSPLGSNYRFNSQSQEISGKEGNLIELLITAQDVDNNELQIWADNLPPFARFDLEKGIFSWLPSENAAGIYDDVSFNVSDGSATVSQTLTFKIAPTNQAPNLIPVGNQTVLEGDSIRFELEGNDAENNNLTYSSNLLPGGSKLNPETGVFEWTPDYFQAGVYNIPFNVSDGESVTTQTVEITVLNPAPIFDELDSWQVTEGQTIRFRTFALDPDNPGFIPQERSTDGSLTLLEGSQPTVTYTGINLPSGASYDIETGYFVWTPDYNSAGEYNLTFRAEDDGDGTGLNAIVDAIVPINVSNLNRRPQVTEVENQTLNVGETLNLTLTASDLDGDSLILGLDRENSLAVPNFISFQDNNDGTASLTVTPQLGDRGDYPLIFRAQDALGAEVLTSFVLSVNSDNEPPKLPFISSKVAVTGEVLEFLIPVEDVDEDDLIYSLAGLPDNATITDTVVYGEALFRWTPTLENLGNYSATISVSDTGNNSDTANFNIIVRENNLAPEINLLDDLTIAEGDSLTINIPGEDADGDILNYTANNLPRGATLNPETGELTWTPDYFQAGFYSDIEIIVSDGNLSDSQLINIRVDNTNRAPEIIPLVAQRGRENAPIKLNLLATDIDRNRVSYAIANLPTGAKLNTQTGEFNWTPNYNQSGAYSLELTATDSGGLTDTEIIEINISNVNRAPSLNVGAIPPWLPLSNLQFSFSTDC